MESKINIKRLYVCDQPHDKWYDYIYSPYYKGSPHNDKHLFDIYSLTHIFWSALLVVVARSIFGNNIWIPVIVFIFTSMFEIHENTLTSIINYRRIEIDSSGITSYKGDSLINVFGDIISNSIGIYLAMNLSRQTVTVILTVLFMVITNVTGISYWTEFFEFLSEV